MSNVGKQLPYQVRKELYDFAQKNPDMGTRELGAKFGIGKDAASRYRKEAPVVEPHDIPQELPELHDKIKRIISKSPANEAEIAEALDLRPSERESVRLAISAMKSRGVMIMERHGKFEMHDAALLPTGRTEVISPEVRDGEWTYRFGVVSDQHMCNKHHRSDVLRDAYDTFEREGIKDVYCCGNYIDGEARFNKMELITPPGLRHQLQYVIDNYPNKEGITTHFIDGDDHEGWAAQREGVIPGKLLELMANEAGRNDLHYLGYAECDVELKAKGGSSVMRVAHPGGGSSYATSYAPQKIVESLQGGEKPQILLLGHYHKLGFFYPREVHTMLVPCVTDQSLFMRKHKIQAHVGFAILKIKQNQETGAVERVCPEFFPYFDRKFYQQDFE